MMGLIDQGNFIYHVYYEVKLEIAIDAKSLGRKTLLRF